MLLGLLGDGHVLLEDYPGLAKTLAARSFAEVTEMRFARVQFTPDLMPADVTGSSIWNQRDTDFEFRPGAVFSNLLLADEINRAPPKTQAALLEAMQERQVTTDGVTRLLERPFIVLATQNPIEYEGTYPLPEAQLDRFLLRTGFGYPSADDEWELLERRMERRADEIELEAVSIARRCSRCRRASSTSMSSESVGRYIVELVTGTRESPSTAVGASPRGQPRPAQARTLQGRTGRARLRHARRRQGDRGARTGPSARAQARALGAAPCGRGRRARGARPSADAEGRGRRGARAVTRRASPRLAAYAFLCALGLVGALAGRRPEVAALAAPFALVLALAALADRPPRVSARLSLPRERALEGDELDATLTLRAADGVARIEAYLVLPPTLTVAAGAQPVSRRLLPDEAEEVQLPLRCLRWGSHELGDIRLRAHDTLALFAWEERVTRQHRLRVYPRPEALRRLIAPLATQAAIGSEVARAKGDGLEFVDLRPFVPGDRVRSVNWRASARRGDLLVNERHPERNAEVVVFLDTFVDARRLDASSLDRAVRATATLVSHYLERRDRVGLVALGGTLRWLQPGGGLVQRYRLHRRPARDRGRVHVRLEGREHHPRPNAASARADRRGHTAARPARGRRPARSACARAETSS